MTLRDAEARLLLDEGLDLIGLVGSVSRSPASGYIGLGLSPVVCFYAIGAYDWLRVNIGVEADKFLESEAQRLRRIRARSKLFDGDTKLSEVLRQQKLVDSFNVRVFRNSHVGLLAPLKRWLQPDMGIFFLDQDLVGSTHVATLNFGYDEGLFSDPGVWALPPGQELHEFSQEVGAFVARAVRRLGGIPDLERGAPLVVSISAENHQSTKLYAAIAKELDLPDPRLASLIVAATSQVNFTCRVIAPALRTSLAMRLRFLSWYHAVTGLRLVGAHLRGGRGRRIGAMLSHALGREGARRMKKMRALRNHLAHYSLEPGSDASTDPLDFTCRKSVSMGRDEVDEFVSSELRELSALCRTAVSPGRFGGSAVRE
jgi:hypothetical protein